MYRVILWSRQSGVVLHKGSEIANANAGARRVTNQSLAISKIRVCQDQCQ